MKLPFLPRTMAEKFPDRSAIISSGETLGFRDLSERILAFSAQLHQIGIGPGERLVLEAYNTVEVISLFWAALAQRIIAVPLNYRLPDHAFNVHVDYINSRAIFCRSQRRLPTNIMRINFSRTFRTPHSEALSLPEFLDAEQPVSIIFTSGSTGQPRAVLHAYRNHYYSALGSNQNIPLSGNDRWMLSLPLYHVAGIAILFRTMLAGAAVILPDAQQSLAQNIRRFRPTHLSLVAAQLSDLLEDPAMDEYIPNMKAILMGGSAIPQNLLHRAYERNWPLVLSYGSSEMSSQITATAPGSAYDEWLTSGRLLPFRELRINRAGEIFVRGKTLFPGYWQEDRVLPAQDKEGWFATGDVGRLDRQKRLIVKGRKDRMFISGGENIYPEEIERALERLPHIRRAVVVAVHHARYGKRPVAFVQMSTEGGINEDELKNELRKTLPGFKIPAHFFKWPKDAPQGMKVNLKWFEKKAKNLA